MGLPRIESRPPIARQRRVIGVAVVAGAAGVVGPVVAAGTGAPVPNLNHGDRSPNFERKVLPVRVTLALEPSRTIFSTRPYHSPCPSRCVTSTRFRVPSEGQAFWIAARVIVVFQVCTPLPLHAVVGVGLGDEVGHGCPRRTSHRCSSRTG